jgi:hypothetical protein
LTNWFHPGSRFSKLIFFVDSTFNSKKRPHITFFSKNVAFSSRPFWTLRLFFGQKRVKFTKWPPKMSRHEILYTNETLFYVKSSKFSIFPFPSFEEIGIHLQCIFPKQLSLNGRYLKKDIFNHFQSLHTVSTHFDNSISEMKSMWPFKVFFLVIFKIFNFQGGVPVLSEWQNSVLAKLFFFKFNIPFQDKVSHNVFFKWQTNFLELFSVFWPFLCPFFWWIDQIICKKYKSYRNVTNIVIVKLAYLSIFDTFRVIKNRFDYLFEKNLKLYFSI